MKDPKKKSKPKEEKEPFYEPYIPEKNKLKTEKQADKSLFDSLIKKASRPLK